MTPLDSHWRRQSLCVSRRSNWSLETIVAFSRVNMMVAQSLPSKAGEIVYGVKRQGACAGTEHIPPISDIIELRGRKKLLFKKMFLKYLLWISCGCLCLCVRSRFCYFRLFVTQWTGACQAPLSMGILQARIPEWVAISSSARIFLTQESNPCLFCLLHWRQVLCHGATWEALRVVCYTAKAN